MDTLINLYYYIIIIIIIIKTGANLSAARVAQSFILYYWLSDALAELHLMRACPEAILRRL